MTKKTIEAKRPSNVGLRSRHTTSHGRLYSVYSPLTENEELKPINVLRRGISGTQNLDKEDSKNNEPRNMQISDFAFVDLKADCAMMRFELSYLPYDSMFEVCIGEMKDQSNTTKFKEDVLNLIEQAKESGSLEEVATRYAYNLVNGRALFRNKTVSNTIKTSVDIINTDGSSTNFIVSSNELNPDDFNADVKDLSLLSNTIKAQLQGNKSALEKKIRISIYFYPKVDGIEVYPSEVYIKKPQGQTRIYLTDMNMKLNRNMENAQVMGQALMRNDKIMNAIRTIDDWYSDEKVKAIALEPCGASSKDGLFYRTKKANNTAFYYLDNLKDIKSGSNEERFMLGVFERGGVFGKSNG